MFLAVIFGLLSAVAAVVFGVASYRRKQREKEFRRQGSVAEFGLPDSRNQYLRSRLQTTLSVGEECRLPVDVRFLHARKLLYALSEKRLSGADSLLLHKLQKEVGRYSTEETVSAYETEKISAALSKLLSLCAKYEV
jgi:hypothetical protein